MRLNEYLAKYGMPKTELARRCGVSITTIHNILRGKNIQLKIALKIEEVTEGMVSPKELLPVEDEKKSRKKV